MSLSSCGRKLCLNFELTVSPLQECFATNVSLLSIRLIERIVLGDVMGNHKPLRALRKC